MSFPSQTALVAAAVSAGLAGFEIYDPTAWPGGDVVAYKCRWLDLSGDVAVEVGGGVYDVDGEWYFNFDRAYAKRQAEKKAFADWCTNTAPWPVVDYHYLPTQAGKSGILAAIVGGDEVYFRVYLDGGVQTISITLDQYVAAIGR